MIKAVVLLKRKDELTGEDFANWLLQEHLPMVLKLPGLRRYQAKLAAYDTDLGKAVAADSLAHVKLRKRFVVREHPFDPPSNQGG